MNFLLFSKVFYIILLAELGDKTQLAILVQSACASSRWIVLAAAVLALALSTAIAVFAGGAFCRLVSPRCIKIAGGLLFLAFGLLMLREGFAKDTGADTPAAPAETRPHAE